MNLIDRYQDAPANYGMCDMCGSQMVKDPEGEYVLLSDVKPIIEQLEKENERLREALKANMLALNPFAVIGKSIAESDYRHFEIMNMHFVDAYNSQVKAAEALEGK